MKIYLTGFMGSGKSTYGEELAEQMGFGFVDLDEEISKKAGKDIKDIFATDGEEAFRKLEQEALLATEKLDKHVIATGGGTPCFHDNMAWMNEKGITVYLKLFEAELHARLREDYEERPLLQKLEEDELLGYIYNTLRQRAYYYHQSRIVIDPVEMEPDMLKEILLTA